MSLQLSINFEPTARASDPATSHQAAQQARELAARAEKQARLRAAPIEGKVA